MGRVLVPWLAMVGFGVRGAIEMKIIEDIFRLIGNFLKAVGRFFIAIFRFLEVGLKWVGSNFTFIVAALLVGTTIYLLIQVFKSENA